MQVREASLLSIERYLPQLLDNGLETKKPDTPGKDMLVKPIKPIEVLLFKVHYYFESSSNLDLTLPTLGSSSDEEQQVHGRRSSTKPFRAILCQTRYCTVLSLSTCH